MSAGNETRGADMYGTPATQEGYNEMVRDQQSETATQGTAHDEWHRNTGPDMAGMCPWDCGAGEAAMDEMQAAHDWEVSTRWVKCAGCKMLHADVQAVRACQAGTSPVLGELERLYDFKDR